MIVRALPWISSGLVPLLLSEKQFWRAVFWRLECAQIQLDAKGCLSPAPRRNEDAVRWNAAVWSPTPIAPPPAGRWPLLARLSDDNIAWDGSPGSPGELQRCGLYTPNGTSLQGYDEFKG